MVYLLKVSLAAGSMFQVSEANKGIRFEDRFAKGWRQKKTNTKSTARNQKPVP
jgi:hypothetical protein